MRVKIEEGKDRVKKSRVFPGVGTPNAISVLVIIKVIFLYFCFVACLVFLSLASVFLLLLRHYRKNANDW